MNINEKDALYMVKNIKINIESKKFSIDSCELFLYSNYLNIISKNYNNQIKIFYKNITFQAINKQKRKIVLCDIKKYNIINIIGNTEEEVTELFNKLYLSINENDKINNDNLELDEDNNEKLLKEWEKKMIFNKSENPE